MNHINLDTQEEAVRQFFLGMPTDPEGAVVEVNGRAVARLVPIPAGKGDRLNGASVWTEEKNARRCFLIDREIDGTLTPEEAVELDGLQRQMLRERQRLTAVPLEDLRRLHQELLKKAQEQVGEGSS